LLSNCSCFSFSFLKQIIGKEIKSITEIGEVGVEGVVITFLRVDAARSFAKRHFPGKAFKIIQNETAVAVSGFKLKVAL
jgi:hypothetical protein